MIIFSTSSNLYSMYLYLLIKKKKRTDIKTNEVSSSKRVSWNSKLYASRLVSMDANSSKQYLRTGSSALHWSKGYRYKILQDDVYDWHDSVCDFSDIPVTYYGYNEMLVNKNGFSVLFEIFHCFNFYFSNMFSYKCTKFHSIEQSHNRWMFLWNAFPTIF